MPSIAHFVLGAIFSLTFYFISEGKFSKTHAFILFMNNYLGPDVGWVLGIGRFTHTYVFYPFFAFFLAYFYHYFTKFSLKLENMREMQLIELDKHKLDYINVYFLVLAGGFMHNYLDSIINRGGIFPIYPSVGENEGIMITIQDFMDLWNVGALELNVIFSVIMGIAFIFGFVFVFVYYLKRMEIKSFLLIIGYLFAFMLFFYLAGSIITLFHSDAGAIVYVIVFWMSPMLLSSLSVRKFSAIKIKKGAKKEHPGLVLGFISLWMICLSLFLLTGGILGLVLNDYIVDFIYSQWESEISMYLAKNEVLGLLIAGEILLLLAGLINILLLVRLLCRNTISWRITVFFNLLFAWTLIGLYMACLLSKDSVKMKFVEKQIY